MSWDSGRSRSVRRTVTFTPGEWQLVASNYALARQARGYRSFNEFARDLFSTGSTRTIHVFCDPAQLRGEIRRIGVNINQITHAMNQAGGATAAQVDAVLAQMDELNGYLADMFTDYAATRHDRKWA